MWSLLPGPSDWVFVVMCVFLFNGVGGALFDMFFFSPEVLPLPPHPIGTGLSHAPNMLPPTAMLSPTSTSPSPACVSFPALDREYTGHEEAHLQPPCTSQMSLGGFKVATYFILIFYLTGFYCKFIIINLLNRNIWQL
jgi:hypothetical protein